MNHAQISPEVDSPPVAAPSTRLGGRWLMLARIAWLVSAVVIVGLFSTAIPVRFHQLQNVWPDAVMRAGQLRPQDAQALSRIGLSMDFYAAYLVTVEVAAAVVFVSVAVVVAWQRSRDGMALFTAGALLLLGTGGGPVLPALAETYPAWQLPVLFIRALAWAAIIIFVYLFPDGQFVPGWTRWLAVLWAAYPLVVLLVPALGPPVALLTPQTLVDLGAIIWFLSSLGVAVVAQVYRYQRVSTAIQRQQTKWVMVGFVATFLLVGGVLAPILLLPSLRQPSVATTLYLVGGVLIVWLAGVLVPLSIGMAVLHYRLWDADPIINRLLVYGTLTAILGLVYVGGVITLQQLFHTLAGHGSQIAIVTSTLAIAALFNPLRRRTQNFIDRRFYRHKYDAAKTLETFSMHLRQETNLDSLSKDLIGVVETALQPAHVSLWLREPEMKR